MIESHDAALVCAKCQQCREYWLRPLLVCIIPPLTSFPEGQRPSFPHGKALSSPNEVRPVGVGLTA